MEPGLRARVQEIRGELVLESCTRLDQIDPSIESQARCEAELAGIQSLPLASSAVGVTVTFTVRSASSMSTLPATSTSVAAPFGFRASKISTTRGRPCVIRLRRRRRVEASAS